MIYRSRLEEEFAKFLQKQGFPAESIIYEPSLTFGDGSRRFVPDFAIIDPKSQERLAVIEVIGRPSLEHEQIVTSKLNKYMEALASTSVEIFFVESSGDSDRPHPFVIKRVSSDGKLDEVPSNIFPEFNSLLANKIANKKGGIERNLRRTVDHFMIMCFSLAVLAFFLIVGDFILKLENINLLTTERLAAFGIGVALVIIPFAAKFKGFGIEYERYITQKPSDKQSP